MTYYTSHHIRAQHVLPPVEQQAPTPKLTEAEMGAAMRAMAEAEGHRGKVPNKQTPVSHIEVRINLVCKVLSERGELSRPQIGQELNLSSAAAHTWVTEALRAGAIDLRGNHLNRTYVLNGAK